MEKDEEANKSIGIPFRYDTFNAFGFCVPRIDPELLGAFGEDLIDELKATF